MAQYYVFSFCNGLYVDSPVANDEVVAFKYSQSGVINKMYLICVNEAVACDSQQIKLDVGISGDDDTFISDYEPADNSLEGTILDITSALLTTVYTAGTEIVLSVSQAGTDGSTAMGQFSLVVELKVATTT